MRQVKLTALAASMAILLSACGGGDPEPTPVPSSVTLTAPGTVEVAEPAKFGSSAATIAGLQYRWDFGDGSTSTEAAPSHGYAKGGDYEVVLRVTNEAGESREVRSRISVLNMANVKGLVCSGENSSGWCWQNPRPTGNAVRNVYFATDKAGWRVGINGEIFRTADAGKTWTPQPSGTTSWLSTIDFFGDKAGWIFGEHGALLRTSDGGNSWTLSKIPVARPFDPFMPTVRALSANVVYLYDTYTPQVTTDGGATWRRLEQRPQFLAGDGTLWFSDYTGVFRRSTDADLTRTTALDLSARGLPPLGTSIVSNGASVVATARYWTYDTGTAQRHALVFISRDGGATWAETKPTVPAFLEAQSEIAAIAADGSTILASIGNTVSTSADGGLSWQPVAGVPASTGSPYYLQDIGYGAIAAGLAGDGAWYLSEDAGRRWSKLALPAEAAAPALTITLTRRADGALMLGGTNGGEYLSLDKGASWALVHMANGRGDAPVLTHSWFLDARKGLILDSKGQLSESNDGGRSWTVKRGDFGTPLGLQFANATTGWLLGAPANAADGRLYRTTDGGATWNAGASAPSFASFVFESAELGWARTSANVWHQTKDGGQTWTPFALPANTLTVRSVSATHLVVAGRDGLLAFSKDGGRTWKEVYSGGGTLDRLTASDANTLWVIGNYGELLRSTDGGEHWTPVQLGSRVYSNDIKFIDAMNGWIVGNGGVVMVTTDGGKTWTRQPTAAYPDLLRIQLVDARTAWITGANGTLLATATGGR